MHPPTPVANGIRTDHPVPGLPFINDSLLDLDSPSAIEAIGRKPNTDTWGRYDLYNVPGAWRAFTTDPENTDYAWVVIHHPSHGRSVTLYRSQDAGEAYSYRGYDHGDVIPLIVRAGGYWSDGTTWRRPTAMRDPVSSLVSWDVPESARRLVVPQARSASPSGTSTTLPDLNARTVTNTSFATVSDEHWRAVELTAWEKARERRTDALPTQQCVVDIIAPELDDDALLSSGEVAEKAQMGASTWRGYIARGVAPAPQRKRSGRPLWARPIIEAYIAHTKRSTPLSGPAMPHSIALTVDRIREDIYQSGRKSFKPSQTSALCDALAEKIIGLAPNAQVIDSMHAAWILQEFKNSQKHSLETVSPVVLDQLESLAWLNHYRVQSALKAYILLGTEEGYNRADLENAVLDAATPGSEIHSLVEEAFTPYWG